MAEKRPHFRYRAGSMFDLVTKHKRAAQVILFLMTIPFAFFGVDYYFRGASDRGCRRDDRRRQDHRRRNTTRRCAISSSERRQMMGASFDPAMFDNPEVRFAVLDQVVNERLLSGQGARSSSFRVTDAQLAEFIASIPAFQDDGKFSNGPLRACSSSAQGMTPRRVRGEAAPGHDDCRRAGADRRRPTSLRVRPPRNSWDCSSSSARCAVAAVERRAVR